MRIKEITITQTANGFMTKEPCVADDDMMPHARGPVISSFENFDSMGDYLRIAFSHDLGIGRGRHAWSTVKDKIWGVDTCVMDQTPEQMRDELGELRRWKESATKTGEDLRRRLNDTIDSLNRSYKNDDARDAEIKALREVNDKLNERLDKRIKKSPRRKA